MKRLISFIYLFAFLSSMSSYVAVAAEISKTDWQRISDKLEKLEKADYPSMAKSSTDWLIDNERYKAKALAGKDGKSVVISNGLVARVFRITPNLATVDIVNQMTSENMLRAVSSEGVRGWRKRQRLESRRERQKAISSTVHLA